MKDLYKKHLHWQLKLFFGGFALLSTQIAFTQGFKDFKDDSVEYKLYSLIKTQNGDNIWSIDLSKKNNLFVAHTLQERGQILLINESDRILQSRTFNAHGKVIVDHEGNMGVFVDDSRKKFWFFSQSDLSLIDSVSVPNLIGELKVFFTQNGILIGGVNSTYLYRNKVVQEMKELKSYKIFDVDPITENMILGYWDDTMHSDAKIRKIFHANLSTPSDKTFLFSTEMYTLYAYYMCKAKKVVAVDGAHKIYSFDLQERKFKVVSNGKHVFSHSKLNENKIALVTNYNGTAPLIRAAGSRFNIEFCSISLVDISTGETSITYNVNRIPMTEKMVLNETNGALYFISSGIDWEVLVLRK